MAKWARVDVNGEVVGKFTRFPPRNIGPTELVAYQDSISHNTQRSPKKCYVERHNGHLHFVAKYEPGMPGRWEIEAWGVVDSDVFDFVNKCLGEMGLA